MATFNKIAKKNNDELYTPRILVEVIRPFLDKWIEERSKKFEFIILWCPFDLADSEFVLFLKDYIKEKNAGKKCILLIYSHIDVPHHYTTFGDDIVDNFVGTGDFFELLNLDICSINKWNYENVLVISNPPFSRKLDIFKKLDEKKISYALLCNTMALNYQEIGNHFADSKLGLIIPDKRVSFDGNASSFNTSYWCGNGFFDGIRFVHIAHNNVGVNCELSRMHKEKK